VYAAGPTRLPETRSSPRSGFSLKLESIDLPYPLTVGIGCHDATGLNQ